MGTEKKQVENVRDGELHLWQWRYTDDFGKRRTTRYLLTEDDAKQRLRDPKKVEHTLERRPAPDSAGRYFNPYTDRNNQ